MHRPVRMSQQTCNKSRLRRIKRRKTFLWLMKVERIQSNLVKFALKVYEQPFSEITSLQVLEMVSTKLDITVQQWTGDSPNFQWYHKQGSIEIRLKFFKCQNRDFFGGVGGGQTSYRILLLYLINRHLKLLHYFVLISYYLQT